MGCSVLVSDGTPPAGVIALFEERDRRFSRFLPSSELNCVNAVPRGLIALSEEFASMLSLALDAARATGGLVTPAVGDALPSLGALRLRGRFLLRSEDVILDLNGVVKAKTVDDALALAGEGWVSAGGDIATTGSLVVGLPGGGTVTLDRGGLATSSVARRAWNGGHHLIDPATGAPSTTPWRDVTVAAASCVAADVAAKAALLLGPAGPSWLDRRGLAGRFVARTGAVTANETWHQLAPGLIAA
jgi:thiamine biosynthesis lipoprotein